MKIINLLKSKEKEIKMLERANGGDMNGLKRVIRTMCNTMLLIYRICTINEDLS